MWIGPENIPQKTNQNMKIMNQKVWAVLAIGTVLLIGGVVACSNKGAETTVTPSLSLVDLTSVVQSHYKSAVTISTSANSIVLKSLGVPDHVTPYLG